MRVQEGRQPPHAFYEGRVICKERASAGLEEGWQREPERTRSTSLIEENVIRGGTGLDAPQNIGVERLGGVG